MGEERGKQELGIEISWLELVVRGCSYQQQIRIKHQYQCNDENKASKESRNEGLCERGSLYLSCVV